MIARNEICETTTLSNATVLSTIAVLCNVKNAQRLSSMRYVSYAGYSKVLQYRFVSVKD